MPEDPLRPEQCAEKLRALGDPTRLRIVGALRSGRRNVGDLAGALGLEMVTVSHHLRILYQAGLVTRAKAGRFVYYAVPAEVLHPGAPETTRDHLDLGCCRIELPGPGPGGAPGPPDE